MDMKSIMGLTLRGKINALVFINIAFVLILVMAASSYLIIHREFEEKGQYALRIAKTVAELPQVRQAFHEPDPALSIAPFVDKIQENAGLQFIVVANMDLIRYSHPDREQIGKHMVGDDNEKVLQGEESITQAVGTLGLSIRGKCPIFDEDHRQIGVVSVGFVVQDLWKRIFILLLQFLYISVAGLSFGLLGAHLLSGHIKKTNIQYGTK